MRGGRNKRNSSLRVRLLLKCLSGGGADLAEGEGNVLQQLVPSDGAEEAKRGEGLDRVLNGKPKSTGYPVAAIEITFGGRLTPLTISIRSAAQASNAFRFSGRYACR